MNVKIDVPSYLQSFTDGLEAVEVSGSTAGECLHDLAERFSGVKKMLFNENGNLHSYVALFVNGTDAYPDELAKPVKEGDHIQIIYIIGGG